MQESALISYYYFGRSTFETKRCLRLAALLYAYLFLAFNSAPIASLHIPVFFFSLICNTNWKFYTMKGASALDLVVTLMFSMTSHFWFVFLSQFYPYGLQAVSLDKCFVNVFLLSMSLFSQCLQYPTSLPKETFWLCPLWILCRTYCEAKTWLFFKVFQFFLFGVILQRPWIDSAQLQKLSSKLRSNVQLWQVNTLMCFDILELPMDNQSIWLWTIPSALLWPIFNHFNRDIQYLAYGLKQN